MIKVLINAYACSPNMGSEPGMAWNWCINLAEHCELHIITEGEFRQNIENALLNLPQARNMHFYYNPLSDKIRKMCWNQGDWRFYGYYHKWQKSTYKIALDIVSREKIDVIHQLNMIGFREPGYLWKFKGIPYVWGPVDAKESFPTAFLKDAPFATALKIRLKNVITKLQLAYSPRVRKAVRSASVVIGASSESVRSFHKYFGIEAPLINETGCYPTNKIQLKEIGEGGKLRLLWVGKFDFRKQPLLALKILNQLPRNQYELHLVGADENEQRYFQEKSVQLGIENDCIWHGKVQHAQVQELMRNSDLFLFTSVAEGTPHVVLEAISNGLPVICFDCCGQGDIINDEIGFKVKLTNLEQSTHNFSEKIIYLSTHREILQNLSINCFNRQISLSWEKKVRVLVDIYNKYIPSYRIK